MYLEIEDLGLGNGSDISLEIVLEVMSGRAVSTEQIIEVMSVKCQRESKDGDWSNWHTAVDLVEETLEIII